MLTPRANTDDLLSRLSSVPSAVQAAASAAPSAYVRARGSGVGKRAAIKAYAERARDQRLHPDRQTALSRFDAPAIKRPGEALDAAALKQAAVKGALNALGRSS